MPDLYGGPTFHYGISFFYFTLPPFTDKATLEEKKTSGARQTGNYTRVPGSREIPGDYY
jgi:hypothetical protein